MTSTTIPAMRETVGILKRRTASATLNVPASAIMSSRAVFCRGSFTHIAISTPERMEMPPMVHIA